MFGLGAGIGGPVGGWMNDTFGWYAEQTWCPEDKLNGRLAQAVCLSVPGQSPVDCEHDVLRTLLISSDPSLGLLVYRRNLESQNPTFPGREKSIFIFENAPHGFRWVCHTYSHH